MKICFMASFTGGGTERATFLLANELSKYHEVYILSNASAEPSFPLDGPVFAHQSCGGLLDTVRKTRAFLKRHHIDVLIALEALGGIGAIPATAFSKCRLIIWEHANYFQTQGSRYTHFMRRLEMRIADAYVVLTKRDLKNFRTHFQRIRTKLVQIYNICEQNQAPDYDLGAKTVISAGHINSIKNFSIIPEIAQAVFKKHPDWNWKIYGDAADDSDRLREAVTKYGVENRVLICGRCADMDKAYAEASVYVMTSLQEGFPMVLLEARSHGLPIVSFNIETGPDEIIQDGVNGFLVEPYDKDEMARKISALADDSALRRAFSVRAAEGLEQWNAGRIAKQWDALLTEIGAH